MTPREIIAASWAITKKEKSLRRWGFISAFFETLLNVKLLGYQGYFLYSYISGKEVGLFDDVNWLYMHVSFPTFLTIVISFCILVATEFFLPHLCEGAIIGLAAKSHRGEPVRGGLVLALHNFLQLFAIHEIFVLSGWALVVSSISMTLRYVSGSVKYAAIFGIIAIFCISNILKLFAGFAEQGVVLQKKSIGGGIAQSYKLLLSHLTQIMFILVLLFVISLRILINALMIMLIPGLVIGLGLFLALFLNPLVSYLISGGIGIALILGASYFFAYLHVFKTTVWTLTYIQLIKHKELDVIM